MGIDFEKALNEEQYSVVTAEDGPMLVLAAAGTGKTRTLVYRVAYLVEHGIAADRILLLTFTNKAAREMLDRSTSLVGLGISGVWGGTFHHMANRMLRRYGSLLGYPADYTILDRDDSRTLVSECVKMLGFQGKEFPKRDVLLQIFGSAANTEQPIEDIVDERFHELEVDAADIVAVHRAFVERKKGLGAMDFDDMLTKCLQLFREHPDVLERYQQQFIYVLVDEYQDTNTIQAQLVDSIAERHRNLMVVGDDFQSIYSWRGADFRNILSFSDRYADAREFRLETNYRSVPEILDVANACIAGNPEQFQKVLRPTRESYKKPKVATLRDGDDQARYVVGQISKFLGEGYRASEIAVLYRAHFHAMEVQLALARANIPYIITSGVRFFEQAHIKDVCSLLRILENPSDELAFSRLIQLLGGVGPMTAIKIWKKLGRNFDVSSKPQQGIVEQSLKSRAKEGWKEIRSVFPASKEADTAEEGGREIEAFLECFYAQYAEATFENADRRIDDVHELAAFIRKFDSVENFLSEVALLTNMDAESDRIRNGNSDDCIRLSTVHQAKGLEWAAVVVLWVTDGMFPSSRAINESEGGESEERRLFYVAVTRAKDELCLCVPELRRMRDGGIYYCEPSRYVEELDPGLIKDVRPGYF
jgi:DNA helicase-2/ATP-dependent DNA helicase PcrA